MAKKQKQKQITELTVADEAMLDRVCDEWIAIGLSTEPADRQAAEAAIARVYRAGGLECPSRIEWAASPIAGARLCKDEGRLWGSAYHGGNMWSGWLGFYDAMHRLGVEECSDLLPTMDLAKSAGWWFSFEDLAVLCDRPDRIVLDDQGNLHCEDGSAVSYRDGWQICAWHGAMVPNVWILDKGSLSPATVLAHSNAEVRRAGCEILGWANMLRDLDAVVIDKDANPQVGTVLSVDLPDAPGSRFLLARCGTGRDFAMPIPDEIKTAIEAQAWIWQVTPDQYRALEVRT